MVAIWILVIGLCVPLALNVTHHLTANGFQASQSRAVWADNRLALLHPPAAAQPLMVQGLSLAQGRSLAQTSGLPARRLYSLSSGGWLYLPTVATAYQTEAQFRHQATQRGGAAHIVDTTAVGQQVINDASATLKLSGIIAIPALIILLLGVFGSVAAAVLPLIVAIAGSEVSLAIVDVLENHIRLSVYLTDIVSFLALGVGVDYALFISNRFRQELSQGVARRVALQIAMGQAGRSVFFSGIAVAAAMATMLLGGTAYWRGLALGGAIAVLVTLLATHTLLPAVLDWFGPGLEWGRLPRLSRHSIWPAVGRAVTARPWLFAGAAVLVLAIPAYWGFGMQMRSPANLAEMLPTKNPYREAIVLQQRINGQGSIAPLAVVLQLPAKVTAPSSLTTIRAVTRHLKSLPSVLQVASPTAILSEAGALPPLAVKQQLAAFTDPGGHPHLVALFVTSRFGPDSSQTAGLIRQINQSVPPLLPNGARFGVGGIASTMTSFNHLIASRLPWILAAVCTVAIAILLIATGSIIQAVLGVVFDGLVALATAGLLVLVVQQGRFGFLPQPLNSSITPLIFTLLFGLSMDYEVIVVHRIQEALRGSQAVGPAAAQGLSDTGAMVTGAGLIMATVFLVLIVSPLAIMRTMAVGLTAAILLDTWIVRTILLPASVAILGRWAFWPFGSHRQSGDPT